MKINRHLLVAGAALGLPLFIVLSWYPSQLIAGLLLLGFVPGLALLYALFPHAEYIFCSKAEQSLLAVGVSLSLSVTLLLIYAFARIPLTPLLISVGLSGLTLIAVLISWLRNSSFVARDTPLHQPTISNTSKKSSLIWLFIILITAGFFRIANVSYSDHQGDEADILLRAVAVTYGQSEALLTHSKGPGEILLLAGIGTLTGRFDELTARLPFSLAGTVSIGLIFLLGTRLFHWHVGAVAGILTAIDGVFVSYARTAQYQSVVLLLSLTAIWCLYRFSEATTKSTPHPHPLSPRERGWGRGLSPLHPLGLFLLAGAFLFHFETILLLPVAGYLTVAPIWYDRWGRSPTAPPLQPKDYLSRLLSLWPSFLIFLLVVAIFYIPFLLHPAVSNTGTYLEGRISGGQSSPPYNNLAHFFYFEALKYNSVYYAALFAGVLGAVILLAVLSWSRLTSVGLFRPLSLIPGWLGSGLVLASVGLGLLLSLLGSGWLSALFIALGFALFFALAILLPQTSHVHRLLWLWVAPPFWIYVFLVNRPGKHHYLFLAALALLVGEGIVQGWAWLTKRWSWLMQPPGRWLSAGLVGLILLLFAGHSVLILLRSDLEYVLTYPAHKSTVYPTDADYPYRTRIGFGYPFRLGWQTLSELRRTGQLSGSWAGNDGGNAPLWYMLNTEPTPCYPDFVLRGEITYKGDDDYDVPFDPANFGYIPRYRIWVNDQLRQTVLVFDPLAQSTEVKDLSGSSSFARPLTAADFATSFAEVPSEPTSWLDPPLALGEGSELKNNAPAEYLERAQQLHGRIALVGYDFEQAYAVPGSIVPITLYWHVQEILSLRYKVFVHLLGPDGQLWAQADDFPVCGTSHANSWGAGQQVQDRYLLKLSAEMPPGDYTMVVGMYEPDLNLRLNYFDIANNEQGNSLSVGQVAVEAR